MRIEKSCLIDAPREKVWGLLADPQTYPRLMHGVTRFDHMNDVEQAPGARYRMLMRVGSEATTSDEGLASWVEAGADYAASLPPKG